MGARSPLSLGVGAIGLAGVLLTLIVPAAASVGTPATAAPTVTTTAVLTSADSYIEAGSPTKNYGTSSALKLRNSSSARSIFVSFTVPSEAGDITGASLELYGTSSCAISASIGVVSGPWTERGITARNAPAIGAAVGRLDTLTGAGWARANVTATTPSSGQVSFGLVAPTSGSCSFASRERGSSTAPRLLVTRTITPPPAPNDPVIAAVGDMACDPTDQNYNGGAGLGSYCRSAAVAAVVAAMQPDALLALGDMQYEDGTLAKFQSSYAPAWSQFDSIVHPVVGNHEYLDPGAAGYFSYFGSKAGDPSTGYYSFDLGSWHIIMLNGECSSVAGGCSAGSPQETWLRQDLAGHPNTCTMAVWHRPRFTSGEVQAPTTPQGQATFWADLYAAGADVVMGGHIHNYERFAPIAPDGTADAATGLREFVVGTGGKSLVGFNATTWPTSQVRDSSHYGALRMVLHPGSYDWQFVPIGGGSPIDSGSQPCH